MEITPDTITTILTTALGALGAYTTRLVGRLDELAKGHNTHTATMESRCEVFAEKHATALSSIQRIGERVGELETQRHTTAQIISHLSDTQQTLTATHNEITEVLHRIDKRLTRIETQMEKHEYSN